MEGVAGGLTWTMRVMRNVNGTDDTKDQCGVSTEAIRP